MALTSWLKISDAPSSMIKKRQTPESGISPNIAPKSVTPKNHLQIWDSSATLIGQLATVTTFGAGVRWSITFWLLSGLSPLLDVIFNDFWRHESTLSRIF